VDTLQGLQVEGCGGFGEVPGKEVPDLLVCGGRVRGLAQLNVGVIGVAAPLIQPLPPELEELEGHHKIELQVGICGDVLHDPGHHQVEHVLQTDDLPDRVFVAEILLCDGLGDHERIELGKYLFRVPDDQAEAEHGEERGISHAQPDLVEALVPVADQEARGVREAAGIGDLGDLVLEGRPQGSRRDRHREQLPAPVGLLFHRTEEAVRLDMESIIAHLVPDPHQDQDAAGDPNSQPEDVDEGITPVLSQVAERCFDVAEEHFSLSRFENSGDRVPHPSWIIKTSHRGDIPASGQTRGGPSATTRFVIVLSGAIMEA